MNRNRVRVRFAPSPTGHLHIGNARTAILNWLFARHSNGDFILRIEDTDPERSKDEYITQIYDDLKWLGLDWNEGPDIGGDYGPYRQSKRFKIYQEYAQKLLESGVAYNCYCTAEELEQARKTALSKSESIHYNQRCFNLTEKEKKTFEKEGRKPAIRFHVPKGEIKFNDIVKGSISFSDENIGDFVIMRQEGIPTYNFACVVDDYLMAITHIIRGDDHVSNTPKQVLLNNALKFENPQFIHIPMILGPDRLRLSKRHGATSIDEYQLKGYLPQALINYLSLLSWSSISGDEILSIGRLIEEFDFNRISKSAAIFDATKLNWMNGYYIRMMNIDELTHLTIPFFKKAGYEMIDFDKAKKIMTLLQDKIEYLEQITQHAKIFFQDQVNINKHEARTIIHKDTSQKVLWSFLRELRTVEYIDVDIFRAAMKAVQKETGIMGKDLWMPVRIALTGEMHGPELPQVVELLGKEKCERFIEKVVGGKR